MSETLLKRKKKKPVPAAAPSNETELASLRADIERVRTALVQFLDAHTDYVKDVTVSSKEESEDIYRRLNETARRLTEVEQKLAQFNEGVAAVNKIQKLYDRFNEGMLRIATEVNKIQKLCVSRGWASWGK